VKIPVEDLSSEIRTTKEFSFYCCISCLIVVCTVAIMFLILSIFYFV
jgi:hypothetical protein